jgi:putative RNA 2'-phosphotransferase
VLRVAAGEMHRQGHAFYRADNGVWLNDSVPPQFLAD